MRGMAQVHDVNPLDAAAVVELCRTILPDLVVVMPTVALIRGVADAVREAGFTCFGVSADVAKQVEHRTEAKQLMFDAEVPTARSVWCHSIDEVTQALDEFDGSWVVKDDNSQMRSGVLMTSDRDAAIAHAYKCGSQVLVEELLEGPEVSVVAVCDNSTARMLLPVQDYRHLLDDDGGPTTSGMGSFAPLSWVPDGLADQAHSQIIVPLLNQFVERGTPLQGFVRVRLVLTPIGPTVVELGVTVPDPEAQTLLALGQSSPSSILLGAAKGELASIPPIAWAEQSAATVVVAAEGYPAAPKCGGVIDLPEDTETAWVLPSGTTLDAEGQLVADRGRVLSVVAVGQNPAEARERVYDMIDQIHYEDGIYRTDVGEAIDPSDYEAAVAQLQDAIAADPELRGEQGSPAEAPAAQPVDQATE